MQRQQQPNFDNLITEVGFANVSSDGANGGLRLLRKKSQQNDYATKKGNRYMDEVLKSSDRRILRSYRKTKRKTMPRTRLPSMNRNTNVQKPLLLRSCDDLNQESEHSIFRCAICKQMLDVPVTIKCGHSFCLNCFNVRSFSGKCFVCLMDIEPERSVDVLVQNLIEKWQKNSKIANYTEDSINTQTRYHLRSGLVGLRTQQNTAKTKHHSNKETTSWRSVINLADVECILCSGCLLDPVTTACGHTFCRGCLTRVLDHGFPCPLCMFPLAVHDYSRAVNLVLRDAIRWLFPHEQLSADHNQIHIAVFICTNAFPGVACPLYVFEPRYRLLVRRCLASSNRRFAMAAKSENIEGGKFVSYGTVLEVRDAVLLEDGSFILTTIGVSRFKVVTRGEKDGYDTAKISFLRDSASENEAELDVLHKKVYNKAIRWIQSLTTKVLDEVERLIGRMPKVEKNWLSLPNGPLWTWWLMPILPLNSQLQVGFLSTINLEKRLRAIDKMLERMEIRMRALEKNSDSACFSEMEDPCESCIESDL